MLTELEERGRRATRIGALQLRGLEDPALLRAMAERFDDWILVTADDRMPGDHADAIAELGATLGVVAPSRPGWHADAWRREVVHRWAHVMQEQAAGTVRRYSALRHGVWRPRRGR